MDLWLRFTNVVTIGNIMSVVTLILTGIYGFYRIRRYLAQQHAEFVAYLATLTEQQTTRIEACIHKLPEHPESSTSGDNSIQQPKN
jgi:hypothetical protein